MTRVQVHAGVLSDMFRGACMFTFTYASAVREAVESTAKANSPAKGRSSACKKDLAAAPFPHRFRRRLLHVFQGERLPCMQHVQPGAITQHPAVLARCKEKRL